MHIFLCFCRYLVTFSSVVDNPADPQNVIIWDVKTGMKKRTFSKLSKEEWPVIKLEQHDFSSEISRKKYTLSTCIKYMYQCINYMPV